MPTNSRPLEIASFLDQQGWGSASPQAFDGDFSPRRYARLTQADGTTAILMDADANQQTPQFVAVAEVLRGLGITAPQIYAAAPDQGLVLLQDFGTRNIGVLLDQGSDGGPYFGRAASVLAKLHRGFDPVNMPTLALPLYNMGLFTTQAELFLDGYFPLALQREASSVERQDFRAAMGVVLRPLETMPKSLLLRDFMPDNLMDLPPDGLGVLDFQDAGFGPIAYDLASLCEEVRRDGGFARLAHVIDHYRAQSGTNLSHNDLMRACTLLSAQRHIRIMGIIPQLALKTGRREKLAFLPRIRQHLTRILQEPYLLPLREWIEHFESLTP